MSWAAIGALQKAPGALRSASMLVLVLATAGMLSMSSEADTLEGRIPANGEKARADRGGDAAVEPLQDVHFAVCPCWLTPKELVEEIEEFHSDISFECYLSVGSFSVEISAHSSGVGGPFQSEVSTPQNRSVSDSRCRHMQLRPRINISVSEDLRTANQRSACLSIVTNAAAQLGCQD